jgi:MFS family permease
MMAMLSWLVAFLAFAAARSGSGISAAGLTTIGAAVSLLALPASILGNEGALRLGRRRFVSLAMAASAAMACLVGASATLPFAAAAAACLVYGVLVASDSASLTAGTVGAAEPGRTGATIAMHTFLGFSGGFLGPLAFGAILDLGGGREDVTAWGLAFAALGLATLMGPLALRRWAEAGPRTASRRARS